MSEEQHNHLTTSHGHWVVEVDFTDGEDQHFVFLTHEQALEALQAILEAEPGAVIKLSDLVFIQRDHVVSAQVRGTNA